MRIPSKVIKTRTVYNRTFEMQISKITGDGPYKGKYQATYYYGADPMIWGDAYLSKEIAIRSCDECFDLVFKQAIQDGKETQSTMSADADED